MINKLKMITKMKSKLLKFITTKIGIITKTGDEDEEDVIEIIDVDIGFCATGLFNDNKILDTHLSFQYNKQLQVKQTLSV